MPVDDGLHGFRSLSLIGDIGNMAVRLDPFVEQPGNCVAHLLRVTSDDPYCRAVCSALTRECQPETA